MSDQDNQEDMYGMEDGMMEGEYGQEDMYGMEGEMAYDEDGNPIGMYGDEEGMEYDENGQPMGYDGMEYGDGYGQEEEENAEAESINFEENPEFQDLPKLDKMRKIRRQIIQTINNVREAHGVPSIYVDHLGNQAANEYANWLMSNPEDPAKAQEICKAHQVIGEMVPLVGFAILEEDEDHQPSLTEQMMDAHGLLLELEHEVSILADAKNTHVGVGFAFNKEQVKVVEFVTQKTLMVQSLQKSEDGGVEARGIVLNKDIGLYAARLVALSKMTKDIKVVGPANITFQKSTGNFVINFPGPINDVFYSQDPKVIEFYIRRSQIDKIQYGVDSGERVNVAHLELAMSMPMEFIPDPRTVLEDAADMEREEKDRQIRARKQHELNLIKQAEKVARQAEREKQKQALLEAKQDQGSDEGSAGMGSSKKGSKQKGSDSKGGSQESEKDGQDSDQMSQSEEEDEDDEESEDSDDIAELPSQNEMKRDLIQAIEEELREQDQLRRENEELQKQIIMMDSNFEQYDKQPDVQMNEHKYLNTLANVHQVRINLKETQDRYNKMASELQAKLNEKQAKCHEIESQFKELKRSVAQNAVFSRTGKKIPKKTLDEWEESEALKDQEVHQYRLQNIALRNTLANKEKILKKKEQLADGLHLIDFEQLKIENQTLNEKIEERNEELHKLRTKITQTVVILSHTREKLQFVEEQNRIENQKLEELKNQLSMDKNKQNVLKKDREKLLRINQKLRQQTGIVNKKELKQDYDARDNEINAHQELIKKLQEKHGRLTRVIEQATEYQMKKMTN